MFHYSITKIVLWSKLNFKYFLWFQNKLAVISEEQARLWAYGRGDVSTPSSGSHLNPIPTKGGGQIMPTIYWCPHQVWKATGAPEEHQIMSEIFWYLWLANWHNISNNFNYGFDNTIAIWWIYFSTINQMPEKENWIRFYTSICIHVFHYSIIQ